MSIPKKQVGVGLRPPRKDGLKKPNAGRRGTGQTAPKDDSSAEKKAIILHKAHVQSGNRDESLSLAEQLATKYANSADVISYLAEWYGQVGENDKSLDLLHQALRIDPSNQHACCLAVNQLILHGKIEQARNLIRPLENTYTPEIFALFISLSNVLVSTGDHAGAYDVCQIALRQNPSVVLKNSNVIKTIKQLEKRLNIAVSVLPNKKKSILLKIVISFAILVGLVGSAGYYYLHKLQNEQLLYVINQTANIAELSFPSGQRITIPATSNLAVKAKVGSYSIQVKSGKTTKTVNLNMESSIEELVKNINVFVLNVHGQAILSRVSTGSAVTSDSEIIVGKEFLRFTDTSPTFASSRGKANDLKIVKLPPQEMAKIFKKYNLGDAKIKIFMDEYLQSDLGSKEAYKLYKKMLPESDTFEIMDSYVMSNSNSFDDIKFVEYYFEKVKLKFPNKIKFVGKLQGILKKHSKNAQLTFQYAMLVSGSQRKKFLERTLLLDPTFHQASYQQSLDHASRGNIKKAQMAIANACKYSVNNAKYQQLLFEMEIANGEYEILAQRLKHNLKNNQKNPQYLRNMAIVQVALGNKREARDYTEQCLVSIKESNDENKSEKIADHEIWSAGLLADSYALERVAENHKNDKTKAIAKFESQLLREKPDKADEYLGTVISTGPRNLLLYLEWAALGNRKSREQLSIKHAQNSFKNQGGNFNKIAQLFNGKSTAKQLEIVDSLAIPLQQKAVIYLGLAQLYPRYRTSLLRKTKKLNFSPSFQWHMINRHHKRLTTK